MYSSMLFIFCLCRIPSILTFFSCLFSCLPFWLPFWLPIWDAIKAANMVSRLLGFFSSVGGCRVSLSRSMFSWSSWMYWSMRWLTSYWTLVAENLCCVVTALIGHFVARRK